MLFNQFVELTRGKPTTDGQYTITPQDSGEWSIQKGVGQKTTFYAVKCNSEGLWSCDCGDFLFRKQRMDSICKHIRMVMKTV